MAIPHKENIFATGEPQFSPNRFKLLVVGSDNVGKTAFIRRLVDNTFLENTDEVKTGTTNINNTKTFAVAKVIQGTIVKVDIQNVDLSLFRINQEPTSSTSVGFHQVRDWLDVKGVILLYDTTNLESFKEIIRYLPRIEQKIVPDCDICLVGTKADLKEHRQVPFDVAEKETIVLGLSLFEISAKSGINCEEVLLETLDKLIERRDEVTEYVEEVDMIYGDPVETKNDHEPERPNLLCWLPRMLWRRK